MKKILLLAVLCAGAIWGQVPTISNVSIDSLDTTGFRVFFTVNGPAWAEVFYGTSSGNYSYNTKSINCYNSSAPCSPNGGKSSLSVTGLAPATTYYVRVTARPDPNDDANICNADACGSTELVVTTLAGVQPAPVVAPVSWTPSAPDTSSYTVIPLQVSGTGECQAAATVTSADGWNVSAGDTVYTILNEIGYGTVLELPQGAACLVPPTTPGGNPGTGYVLPGKPLDSSAACGGTCAMTDPNHRWIVFRTKQTSGGDFPPFGARIDPSFAPKLGKFYSAQPNQFSQLFNAEGAGAPVHHFWWQNVEFEDDPNYSNPTDAVDPVGFQFFAQVGSQYSQTNNNNQFLVFDRVYAHGPGAPIRHINAFELGGNYQAMVGCYTAQVEAWRMTQWPSFPGVLSNGNTVLTIPQNNFRLASDSPTLGMQGPATVTLGQITNSGTVIGNLYKDHLEIQYPSGIGTITCSGCSLTPTTTPATPATAIQLFSVTVTAAGQFSGINWNTQEYQTSRYIMSFGITFSDLKAAGGPYLFDNNYVDGLGEGFYVDPVYSNFAHDDVTYIRNHHIWPKNAFMGAPGNLWRYEVRQHWEMKRGHRYLLRGNLFSYSWSYQNDGPAIFLSGRPTYVAQSLNDGISDVTIESNTISHGRTGIACQNGNPMDNNGGAYEPEPVKRVTISNNLMFDLGRWKYCDSINCPSLGSFYFENRPGCQDLVISSNTGDVTYGEIPSLIYLGGGQMLSNHLTFQNNILHFSQGLSGYGGGNFGDWPPNNVSNHNVTPAVNYSDNGAAPNFKSNLDASIVNTTTNTAPHYSWSNNVLIGGFIGSTLASAVDMTYAQVLSYAANMPPGDIYPAGDTIAARQAAVGLNPGTWRSSVYNPAGIGADIDLLISDMGRVSGVQAPMVSSESASFTYVAPDARVCSVDVSADGNTWIRTNDSGGQRPRTVNVEGLAPSTRYQSRILCYYTQQNDGVLYTDYAADEITTASFMTAASPATALRGRAITRGRVMAR
jgi:hypothetical protein